MEAMKAPFCVLSIAGSDSGAGAGIQADQRTIEALGGHGLAAVTAITAQNGRGVSAWKPVGPALVSQQIDACLGGFSVGAAKTGLLPGASAVSAVARSFAKVRGVPLVVDPVIASTSGTRFLDRSGMKALLGQLMPLAAVTTPNWEEASALSGMPVRGFGQAERAAIVLARLVASPVLVKGGHGKGPVCRDCLALPSGEVQWFQAERIPTRNSHGTGCVLSAAIACSLAQGLDLATAIERARGFLRRALFGGRGLVWEGRGPAFVAISRPRA